MADQKVRVLVERLPEGRIRLRFLSRAHSMETADERDADHELMTGGGIVGSDTLSQEALLASISLGHMEAYIALCTRNDLIVDIYRDDAICTMQDDDSEHPCVHVLLRPRLAFRGDDTPAMRATAIRLLSEALGQSVFYEAPRISIELEPVFEFRTSGSLDA